MALLPPHLVHLAVRWVHVLGMATLLGGAVLLWGRLHAASAPANTVASEATAAPLRLAATYEWLFLAGAGLLVLTGVGNLGAMAPAIPGPATGWGRTFSVKLVVVVGLLVGSMVRTLGVVELCARASRPGVPSFDRLRFAYAATAVYLLLVVALAEVLAHG